MTLTRHQEAALLIACGLYLVILSLTSKTLITESDIPATEEERAKAKATPTGRLIGTAFGVVVCAYGLYLLLH